MEITKPPKAMLTKKVLKYEELCDGLGQLERLGLLGQDLAVFKDLQGILIGFMEPINIERQVLEPINFHSWGLKPILFQCLLQLHKP